MYVCIHYSDSHYMLGRVAPSNSICCSILKILLHASLASHFGSFLIHIHVHSQGHVHVHVYVIILS